MHLFGELWELLVTLAVGGLSGWLAGYFMKTKYSMVINIVIGLIGGFLGKLIMGILGLGGPTNIIGSIIVAVCGSCLLIWLVRKIAGK